MLLIEDPVPRNVFIKKRIKKLGLFNVGGQVLFQMLVVKLLTLRSKERIKEIIANYHLNITPIPDCRKKEVISVNSQECISELKNIQPDLVIVHGTRIISKKVLDEVNCFFINIHAGITPRYRGSHGAYWALANNDPEHCGVTVHLVDKGIDTGNILSQCNIKITPRDNFITYPYIQLAEGLYLLKEEVNKFMNGKLTPIVKDLDSGLWHHPTLWGYLYKRLTKGVK
jgi:methionyl-tRNA formyltransferase